MSCLVTRRLVINEFVSTLKSVAKKAVLVAVLLAAFTGFAALTSGHSHAAINDLNGDGKSDLIARNGSTGEIKAWLMSGTTIVANTTLLNDPKWTVTHVADFNGDGKADIVYRNDDGSVALWLMNGGTLISGAGLLGANSGWTVTHTGDFNGDGKADLLFRHTDGRIAMWLMDGTTLFSGVGILDAASGWSVTHVADFDGDGRSDILFRHTDGRVAMWLMNGTTLASGGGVLDANSGWSVTHTGDFNGDGKADLLFRHTDGRIAMWLMNGIILTSGAGILDAASGWSVTHTADFNSDGKADILFRHTDGRVAMWLMNGITFIGGAGLIGAASGWSVTHTADLNGDGKADLVWRNASDGSIAAWLMNGQFTQSQGIISGASTLRVVPVGAIDETPVAPGTSGTNTKVFYIHSDHLGTPRTITRSTDNQKVWDWENTEAFGNNLPNENPSALGTFGYNLRMPGQYYDKETGTFYNYFRDYDPATGRYIQSDPIGLGAGLNTYAYVGGQPLTYFDRYGEQAQALGCVLGAWGGPVGCGVGAGLATLLIAAPILLSRDTCLPECSPPKGTVCFFIDRVSSSKPHWPIEGSHYHLYQMNQAPDGKCFWNKLEDSATAPPGAIACPFARPKR